MIISPVFVARMAVVTLEEMTEAIRRTLVAHGKIPAEEAGAVALQVLSYFGSEQSILDNILSTEDRDIFYRLEEEGLLSSEEEDAVVDKGKNWRIHYWLLNRNAILDAGGKEVAKVDHPGAVYEKMSSEEWSRGGNRPQASP